MLGIRLIKHFWLGKMVKKALLIACSYPHTPEHLRGCANDVVRMQGLLTEYFNFSEENITIMRDDVKHGDPTLIPTKANMTQQIRQFAEGAKSGDSLFFHFSGHGSQQADLDGDEVRDAPGQHQVLLFSAPIGWRSSQTPVSLITMWVLLCRMMVWMKRCARVTSKSAACSTMTTSTL